MNRVSIATIALVGASMVGVVTLSTLAGGAGPSRVSPQTSAGSLTIAAADDDAPLGRQPPMPQDHAQAPEAPPVRLAPFSSAPGSQSQSSTPSALAPVEFRPAEKSAIVDDARADAEDLDCTLDAYGRRAPIPLERVVQGITSRINGFSSQTPLDVVRAEIQTDLNRSGDDEAVKLKAIALLKASFSPQSAAGRALAQPFYLYDDARFARSGYDPCGNPTAIGGKGFSSGPFTSNFTTINPVPVIASRTAAATEGGGT